MAREIGASGAGAQNVFKLEMGCGEGKTATTQAALMEARKLQLAGANKKILWLSRTTQQLEQVERLVRAWGLTAFYLPTHSSCSGRCVLREKTKETLEHRPDILLATYAKFFCSSRDPSSQILSAADILVCDEGHDFAALANSAAAVSLDLPVAGLSITAGSPPKNCNREIRIKENGQMVKGEIVNVFLDGVGAGASGGLVACDLSERDWNLRRLRLSGSADMLGAGLTFFLKSVEEPENGAKASRLIGTRPYSVTADEHLRARFQFSAAVFVSATLNNLEAQSPPPSSILTERRLVTIEPSMDFSEHGRAIQEAEGFATLRRWLERRGFFRGCGLIFAPSKPTAEKIGASVKEQMASLGKSIPVIVGGAKEFDDFLSQNDSCEELNVLIVSFRGSTLAEG